ncbi:MAG TPA: aldehyde dehydrogenase (NADP(+)), partial [Caulobacter sp.]|nr:aldehyde dehydrogenase (NADP(+)) [Caulobacter sp.]
MTITGELLIDGGARAGTGGAIHAVDPSTGDALDVTFGGAAKADLDEACALAAAAFGPYRA